MSIEIIPGVQLASERCVRVTRILVLEGPAEWVLATLERRWLRKGTTPVGLSDGKQAVEQSLTLEVLD